MKQRVEAVLATAATGGSWVAETHQTLQLLISALTLLWWVRIWIRRNKKKDPEP